MNKEEILHLIVTDLEFNMDQADYSPVNLLTNIRYKNNISQIDAFYLEADGKFYKVSIEEAKKEELPESEQQHLKDLNNGE